MTSTAIATVVKMIESLPETTQNQVVEFLRNYVAETQDDIQWDVAFRKSQKQLVEAARRAKREIAKGRAEPFDYNQL